MVEEGEKVKGVFADLHIHSRFSRACSKDITIENLEKWGRVKGLGLIGTGDFTHPIWLKELKEKLIERGGILYSSSGFKFLLTGEISLMYTQGRGRRVHLVLLVPNFETADKINSYFDTKGRRDYDGRPIFKISCEQFTKDMMEISEDIEIIPAHCLLPETFVHVNNSIKKIKDIQSGDFVLTHNNRWRRVKEVLIHNHNGKNIKITPWYFREGITTTSEHPFYGIKSYKCNWIKGLCKKSCSKLKECKNRRFESYLKEWIPANELKKGDFLVYPRLKEEKDIKEIDLSNYISDYKDISNEFIIPKDARNYTGKLKKIINVDDKLCRLIGYFLSEGYLIKENAIGFSFHAKEKDYIQDVISTIRDHFGFEITKIDSRRENQSDLVFSSKLLNSFFRNFYFGANKKANCKCLPTEFTMLPKKKIVEIFRGWWRGDTGYTVSRQLANQMKIICLKLGIIPSISFDLIQQYEKRKKHFIKERKITAKNDLIIFSNLSFFEEDFGVLKETCFKRYVNKMNRKHGWIDNNYIYLPIKKVETKEYSGEVYNLEVEEDNSFTCEFACVHNCWTPWFGIFGSSTGFNRLKEAFDEQEKNIHAIETGMSSDPEMNWHLSELNNRAIVSFSDSHSFWPWRMGREATIFEKVESYSNVINAIRENKILGTVETAPAYGKYHYDGHINCNFSSSPEETKKLNGICPVCGKPLVIGVANRVNEIGDQDIYRNLARKRYYTLLPLHELIAFSKSSTLSSKKTWEIYNKLIEKFENEFNILLNVSKEELIGELKDDLKLVQLILDNRVGKIKVKPGYDGKYGELEEGEKQARLF
jgi:uncharacterized protein (TIGR00375 family)